MADHYARAGVDRDVLLGFKGLARRIARVTEGNFDVLKKYGILGLVRSNAWSAIVTEREYEYIVHVHECLGTQNLVADTLQRANEGKVKGRFFPYYWRVGWNTGAAIFNDASTVGAQVVGVALHPAVGDGEWFVNDERNRDLLLGFAAACGAATAVWGGGETPVLKVIINPETIGLSGSCWGIVSPKNRLIPGIAIPNDAIVLVGSSGVQMNGLTLALKIGDSLPWEEGYGAKLIDGFIYGEALLAKAVIYAPLIRACLDAGVPINAVVHISGEAWPKVALAAEEPAALIIEKVPERQPVFQFIQDHAGMTDKEMYATYNMGAVCAIFQPREAVAATLAAAERLGFFALEAGYVEPSSETRLVIAPKDIEYGPEELKLR